MSEYLLDAISEVIHILRNSERMGKEVDFPEGSRNIVLSDTLANKLADDMGVELAKLRRPTMYWPGDETMSHEDEFDLVDVLAADQGRDTEQIYTVMCARSLPDRQIRVTVKHNADYEWEWMDGQAAERDGSATGDRGDSPESNRGEVGS